MKRINYILVICLCFFALNIFAQGGESLHDHENSPPILNHPFFKALNRAYQARERLLSFDEAVGYSTSIVVGYIDSVTPGRILKFKVNPDLLEFRTSLLKIEVADVIWGPQKKYVYVEVVTSGYSTEELDENRYLGKVMLLLRDSSPVFDESVYISEDIDPVFMREVDEVYALTLPSKLFVIEDDGNGNRVPISPLHTGQLVNVDDIQLNSFDEIISEIYKSISRNSQ